jgi:hypothetical protein
MILNLERSEKSWTTLAMRRIRNASKSMRSKRRSNWRSSKKIIERACKLDIFL